MRKEEAMEIVEGLGKAVKELEALTEIEQCFYDEMPIGVRETRVGENAINTVNSLATARESIIDAINAVKNIKL